MIKAIIFDLDGTLVDFEKPEAEGEVKIAEEFAKRYKLRPFDVLKIFNEIKRKYLHKSIKPSDYKRSMWYEEVSKKLKIKVDKEFCRDIDRKFWDFVIPRIKWFPETKNVLEKLKGKYKLILMGDCDGEKGEKRERIKKLKIDKYFDFIFTSDDSNYNKPDKRFFEYVVKNAGINPKECVMVGDHPEADLVTAKKMGMKTIWNKENAIPVLVKFNFVDYEIKSIGEIISVIHDL